MLTSERKPSLIVAASCHHHPVLENAAVAENRNKQKKSLSRPEVGPDGSLVLIMISYMSPVWPCDLANRENIQQIFPTTLK